MNILELAGILNMLLNLVLALIIVVWDLYFYFKMDEKEKWTKAFYALVGMGWIVRCVLYLLNVNNFSSENVNAPLVVLVTFTLLALAVGSIIRVQKIVGFEGIKTDVKNLMVRIKQWIFKTS